MAKTIVRISTLTFQCPTCGVPPQIRCLSIKPGVTSRRDLVRMMEDAGEFRLIKSHAARRQLASPQKSGPSKPR